MLNKYYNFINILVAIISYTKINIINIRIKHIPSKTSKEVHNTVRLSNIVLCHL